MDDPAGISSLLTRFRAGDRAALNRLISLVARGESIRAIQDAVADDGPVGRVIALTGNSGVGKSSLIARLIDLIRNRGQTVAVLACDPQSVLTGGALLGDRVRMSAHAADAGVWIRSLAAASGRQAVAAHLDLAARLLGRFGFDHILLETVGAGQGDVAVRGLADVVVLLVQPEIGDELQWEKAGILELADIVIVHKGDLPGAERTQAQVRELLNLPGRLPTPVLRISSRSNTGVDELWAEIEACAARGAGAHRTSLELLRLVQDRVADVFAARPHALQAIIEQWAEGRLSTEQAVEQALATIAQRSSARADHPSPRSS